MYGTFDYRAGCYDLRDGRQQLIDLIGPGMLFLNEEYIVDLSLLVQVLKNWHFAFVPPIDWE